MVREIRSLQVTGGNTFIVSLPKGWVDALNLKPRDKVAIIEREDNSLAIYPLKLLDKKSKKSITFKYSELGEENTLIRECIGKETINVFPPVTCRLLISLTMYIIINKKLKIL